MTASGWIVPFWLDHPFRSFDFHTTSRHDYCVDSVLFDQLHAQQSFSQYTLAQFTTTLSSQTPTRSHTCNREDDNNHDQSEALSISGGGPIKFASTTVSRTNTLAVPLAE
jgi:hypothetical protein